VPGGGEFIQSAKRDELGDEVAYGVSGGLGVCAVFREVDWALVQPGIPEREGGLAGTSVGLDDAGVPDDVEFATKPALAAAMLARALDAGVPARWVTADEVYGADPGLRADREARQIGYVLAIGCDRRVPTTTGPLRADALAANVPKRAWQRLSAGPGAKGQRHYDWALITLTKAPPPLPATGGCWCEGTLELVS
jgi:hypothetical protein